MPSKPHDRPRLQLYGRRRKGRCWRGKLAFAFITHVNNCPCQRTARKLTNRLGSGNRRVKNPSHSLGEEHRKSNFPSSPAEVPHPLQSFPVVGRGSGVGVQGRGRVTKTAAGLGGVSEPWDKQGVDVSPSSRGVRALLSKRPPGRIHGLARAHTAQAPWSQPFCLCSATNTPHQGAQNHQPRGRTGSGSRVPLLTRLFPDQYLTPFYVSV